MTLVGSGITKVELGDDIWELTPAEARHVGMLFAGRATEAAEISSSRAHMLLAANLSAQVERLKKEVSALSKTRDPSQPNLI